MLFSLGENLSHLGQGVRYDRRWGWGVESTEPVWAEILRAHLFLKGS